MFVNANKPNLWKTDIVQSVDFYNDWFLNFAPQAYRETRIMTTQQVMEAMEQTKNLTDIGIDLLQKQPSLLSILRMTTAPPIARDRLIGLAGVKASLVKNMEQAHRLPPRMKPTQVVDELAKIVSIIEKLIDTDIVTWRKTDHIPSQEEVYRVATVVADRLCGAVADPIIRNAQEQRQLASIRSWLEARNYREVQQISVAEMPAGTFSFRFNVPIQQENGREVNIPIDTVVMPHGKTGFPLLIEAKSAGDFANTNKRRKEEAVKFAQLKHTYGDTVQFILFLCGYFNSGYLGYEAAEGIDWVWEHRIDDLVEFGL